MEAELARVEARLADPAVYGDEKKLTRALDRQAQLLEQYGELGGPGYEGRVRSTLISLGFTEADLDLPVEVLSGGQKKLVGLAKLLVTQPDLLLLDEPDNHLDLAGKAFLEQFIRGYKGAVIIVSHDRYLLDLVVDEIVELEDGRLTHYPGNYSEYAFEKQTRLLRQQQLYQAQQKEITRLEQAAKRLLTWGRSTTTTSSPAAARTSSSASTGWSGSTARCWSAGGWAGAERLAGQQQGAGDRRPGQGLSRRPMARRATRPSSWRGSICSSGAASGWGWWARTGPASRCCFGSSSGRLALARKSPAAAEIKIGPSVAIGDYAQEHETLDYERTLIDTVRRAPRFRKTRRVSFLARFLFTYEQARSPVGDPLRR